MAASTLSCVSEKPWMSERWFQGISWTSAAVVVKVPPTPTHTGGRIAAIGENLEPVVPGVAIETIDGAGKIAVPGFIDSHVHLATPPNLPRARAALRRNLYGGVTAVRDMADDLRPVGELAREARVAEIPSPDIYYAALMAGQPMPRNLNLITGASGTTDIEGSYVSGAHGPGYLHIVVVDG